MLGINVFIVLPWPLTLRGHLESKLVLSFERHYRLGDFLSVYLTSTDTFYIVTFLRYLTSKLTGVYLVIFDLKRSPKVNSYVRNPIHDFLSNFFCLFLSISNRFRDIFDLKFQGFDIDLCTSGQKYCTDIILYWGQKYCHHSKDHTVVISYLTAIDTFSLSVPFLRYCFQCFRAWPWHLTFRGHLRSKIFPPLESPYMASYLTSIGTILNPFWDILLQSL